MIKKGWKDRQAAADAKRYARANPDEAAQAIKAERQRHLEEQDAQERARQEAARAEREGPVRAVAAMFVEKFGGDLPEAMDAMAKAGGVAKLIPHLERVVADHLRARREAAQAAAAADQDARLAADREALMARRQAEGDKRAPAKAALAARIKTRRATMQSEEVA